MVASTSPTVILLSSPPHLLLLLMIHAVFEGSKAGDLLLTSNSKLIAAGKSVVGSDVKPVTTQ